MGFYYLSWCWELSSLIFKLLEFVQMSCMNCMEFQSEINTGTTDNPLTEIYFRLDILYNIKF